MNENNLLRDQLHLISLLSLRSGDCAEVVASLSHWEQKRIDDFFGLLGKHHVILRALTPLQEAAANARLSWLEERARAAMAVERERIRVSLQCLDAICKALECAGCPVVLFKTLDHWPDFGSDLDLCTMGDERYILDLIKNTFHGRTRWRSFGNRLSHKWSFELPGDPTEVELHINRLGHAGEHVDLATRFINRRRYIQVNGYSVPVPAPEERVIAATLQRMYRNLYLRVCDIVNLSTLIQNQQLCYDDLRKVALQCGIWPGVAAFLTIVSSYVKAYCGPLPLPEEIHSAAENLNADKLFLKHCFFHVPFAPYGIRLFVRQFAHTVSSGDYVGTARLSLLPPLASIESLAYAVTGSSGRIW